MGIEPSELTPSCAPTAAEVRDGSGRDWAVAILVFVIALSLRLIRLNQGLWSDEIASVNQYFYAPWLDLLTALPNPNHHPLYSLLAKATVMVLGGKEWTFRLPALIAGSLTAPAIYLLGKKIGTRSTGFVAALLLSFSMWPVWFSQDARGYSLMLFLSVVANILFLKLTERWSRRLAVLYALAAVASVYTHLYGVMVPLTHLILAAALGWRRRDPRLPAAALAGLFLAALAYAPMASDFLRYLRTQGHADPGRSLSPGFLLDMVRGFAAGEDRKLLSLPFLLLAAVGLVSLRKRPFHAALLLLPLLLGLAVAAVSQTFVYHRFFLYALPGFLILTALGAERLGQGLPRPRIATALVTLILLAASLPALLTYYQLGKQGLRDISQWLDRARPASPVYTAGVANWVFKYYCPRAQPLLWGQVRAADLDGAVVVVAHPWSAGRQRLQQLTEWCGPPKTVPAAGYRENEVLVFDCRPAGGP